MLADIMAWTFPSIMTRSGMRRPALNLALQGGGAHGAFTWGVLDALLESERFDFAAISGSSAGAINAALLACGSSQGGPGGARAALERFWTALGSHIPFEWLTMGLGDDLAFNPLARMMLRFSQWFAPHEFNPLDHNPLRRLLQEQIDFDALRAGGPRLAIAATHVNSGRLKVFGNESLSVDVLLASACLPTLHHTVVIDGEPYWDGGYSANPALLPLLADRRSAADTLLVLLAPRQYARMPHGAAQIGERAMDIAFQAPFLRELQILDELKSSTDGRWWPRTGIDRRIAAARWHLVDGAPALAQLHGETRMIAHLPFLLRLRDAGRTAAQAWLAEDAANVGRRSGIRLGALAQGTS